MDFIIGVIAGAAVWRFAGIKIEAFIRAKIAG